MKQAQFEKHYEADWRQFEEVLQNLDTFKLKPEAARQFAPAYRRICRNLSIARSRCYAASLIDRLNMLALRGHQYFYSTPSTPIRDGLLFLTRDFPCAVRAESRLVLLNGLLFYGPFFSLILLLHFHPEWVYVFMSQREASEIQEMYAKTFQRGFAQDFYMFGFYIRNNISIGFMCFATGIFMGFGSLFFIVLNGILLGAAFGFMLHQPEAANFFPFVITHGAFELNAIVLSGVAGFRLGLALITPGNLSRKHALQAAGTTAIPIVYGMTLMLFGAAILEAFWSPSNVPPLYKFIVGGLLWALTLFYFLFVGKRDEN